MVLRTSVFVQKHESWPLCFAIAHNTVQVMAVSLYSWVALNVVQVRGSDRKSPFGRVLQHGQAHPERAIHGHPARGEIPPPCRLVFLPLAYNR